MDLSIIFSADVTCLRDPRFFHIRLSYSINETEIESFQQSESISRSRRAWSGAVVTPEALTFGLFTIR